MREEALSRFLGYLFSDASFKTKKSGQYEVTIECADKSIVEDFANICKELLQREIGKIHSRKRSEFWRETYTFTCKINKVFAKKLIELSPTYRTKPYKPYSREFPEIKIPKLIFNNSGNLRNFLQALTNSEGSVHFNVSKNRNWYIITRYVKIACSHPTLLFNVSEMLKSLKIRNRLHPKTVPLSVLIQGKDSMIKFRDNIGFMNGVRVGNSGKWKGEEKRKVLEAAIKTFEIPHGQLQTFHEMDDIYTFLKVNYLPSGF